MSNYCWDVPKLSTNYSDWQNISSVLAALQEHITNAIHVQVNLSGEEQLEVLSVYWDEHSGILHVDVAK